MYIKAEIEEFLVEVEQCMCGDSVTVGVGNTG